MKKLIEQASTQQLDKLWIACYDFTTTCYEIDDANTPEKQLELKCNTEIIIELEKVLRNIMYEESLREREEANQETETEEEEGAI